MLDDVADETESGVKALIEFAKKLNEAEFKDINHVLEHCGELIKDAGTIDADYMNQLKLAIQKGFFDNDKIKLISKLMWDSNLTEYYESVMKKMDFGEFLTNMAGPAIKEIIDAHAHHLVFKVGLSKEQKELVEKAQAILRKHGIDPILGLENLVWAPMRVKGQHSLETLRELIEELIAADGAGGTYDDIVDILKDAAEKAQRRDKYTR